MVINSILLKFQVINQQLTKLQEAAGKCKMLSKSTESQLFFFKKIHPAIQNLLEASNYNFNNDEGMLDIIK